MPDHYTYPGTEVLVNIPGYTDPALWKDAETLVVGTHKAELFSAPIAGGFDLAHLQAIHARLVHGFYSWGGQLRDTDTGPGGTGIAHCRPEYIPAEADRIFTALAGMDYLRGRDTDEFSKGLAWVWGETTVLHPFRDINTRSQFVFFNQLAAEAGWLIDWNMIDPHVFAHARTVAIFRDEDGIDALLHPALIRVEDIARRDDLRQEIDQAKEAFFPRQPSRSREERDAHLRAALERRRRNLAGPENVDRHHPPDPEPPGRTL
ncbi:MAG: Fic/DOC family protein [Lacisediminihabitans sp.]